MRALWAWLNAVPKHPKTIHRHIAATYFALRTGLVVLAAAFPLFLYLWGKFRHGLHLQSSMSAYFFAAAPEQCASFPMRTYFVGFLFAIAAGLFFYRGFTRLENWMLNVAGVAAALVAVFPERINPMDDNEKIQELFQRCPEIQEWAVAQTFPLSMHYISAIALFVMLALVSWVCALNSVDYIPASKVKAFRRAYIGIGIGMLLFPFAGLLAAFIFRDISTALFWIELVGIWVFAAYWAVKSVELKLSPLEPDEGERGGQQ